MTTSQPRHQDPRSLVPPPQFGRLPHSIRWQSSEEAPLSQPYGSKPGIVPELLADFGTRTISFLIDYVAPVIVLNLLLAIGAATDSLVSPRVLTVVGCLGLLSFGIWNSGYLQGTTGQSLGRRVARTALVRIGTGRPVGFGRAVTRQFCHGLEFGVGCLWPLWDDHRQTFADKIVGTVVIRSVAQPTIELTANHSRG